MWLISRLIDSKFVGVWWGSAILVRNDFFHRPSTLHASPGFELLRIQGSNLIPTEHPIWSYQTPSMAPSIDGYDTFDLKFPFLLYLLFEIPTGFAELESNLLPSLCRLDLYFRTLLNELDGLMSVESTSGFSFPRREPLAESAAKPDFTWIDFF